MKYIKTYRKKPIKVEAVKISKDAIDEILEWGEDKINLISDEDDEIVVEIETMTGSHNAVSGDYIIKGIDGNFYAVPQETFCNLYEIENKNSSENYNDCIISW